MPTLIFLPFPSPLPLPSQTLSSLALVFALHHYKPTPLYVMDEIDAALGTYHTYSGTCYTCSGTCYTCSGTWHVLRAIPTVLCAISTVVHDIIQHWHCAAHQRCGAMHTGFVCHPTSHPYCQGHGSGKYAPADVAVRVCAGLEVYVHFLAFHVLYIHSSVSVPPFQCVRLQERVNCCALRQGAHQERAVHHHQVGN